VIEVANSPDQSVSPQNAHIIENQGAVANITSWESSDFDVIEKAESISAEVEVDADGKWRNMAAVHIQRVHRGNRGRLHAYHLQKQKNLAAFSPDVATAKFGRDIAGFSPGDGSPSGNLRDLVSPASSQGGRESLGSVLSHMSIPNTSFSGGEGDSFESETPVLVSPTGSSPATRAAVMSEEQFEMVMDVVERAESPDSQSMQDVLFEKEDQAEDAPHAAKNASLDAMSRDDDVAEISRGKEQYRPQDNALVNTSRESLERGTGADDEVDEYDFDDIDPSLACGISPPASNPPYDWKMHMTAYVEELVPSKDEEYYSRCLKEAAERHANRRKYEEDGEDRTDIEVLPVTDFVQLERQREEELGECMEYLQIHNKVIFDLINAELSEMLPKPHPPKWARGPRKIAPLLRRHENFQPDENDVKRRILEKLHDGEDAGIASGDEEEVAYHIQCVAQASVVKDFGTEGRLQQMQEEIEEATCFEVADQMFDKLVDDVVMDLRSLFARRKLVDANTESEP
jgi:hypothetical protein